MTTIAERRKIAKLVLTTSNDSVIKKIQSLINGEIKSLKNEVKQYNKDIDEAIERMHKGQFYTQQQAENLLAKWEKE